MIKIYVALSTNKAKDKLQTINETDLIERDEETIKAMTKAFEEFLREDNKTLTTYNEDNGLRFTWRS